MVGPWLKFRHRVNNCDRLDCYWAFHFGVLFGLIIVLVRILKGKYVNDIFKNTNKEHVWGYLTLASFTKASF